MTITRYNPFANDAGMKLFEDSLNRFFTTPETARPWTPSVDILENENEIVLMADVPGVEQDNIEIKVEDGTLTLKGERKFEAESENKGYHRIERGHGAFVRYFALPDSVDPEKIDARYNQGVLTVTLPKKEVAKPRSVKVKVH